MALLLKVADSKLNTVTGQEDAGKGGHEDTHNRRFREETMHTTAAEVFHSKLNNLGEKKTQSPG